MKKSLKILSYILVLFVFVSNTSAETKTKKGFYMGAVFPYNTFSGDFDDSTVLTSSSEIIDVPIVESALGWGIVLGLKPRSFSNNTEFELSYHKSEHDTTSSLMGESKATYNVINFDMKAHFPGRR